MTVEIHAVSKFCIVGCIMLAFTSAPAQTKDGGDINQQRADMKELVKLIYEDRNPRIAYERYAVPRLLDEVTGRTVDRSTAATMVEHFVRIPGSIFQVKNLLFDGDLAVVHYYGAFDPKSPGADVAEFFRWKNGKVVSHWAILQVRKNKGEATIEGR